MTTTAPAAPAAYRARPPWRAPRWVHWTSALVGVAFLALALGFLAHGRSVHGTTTVTDPARSERSAVVATTMTCGSVLLTSRAESGTASYVDPFATQEDRLDQGGRATTSGEAGACEAARTQSLALAGIAAVAGLVLLGSGALGLRGHVAQPAPTHVVAPAGS